LLRLCFVDLIYACVVILSLPVILSAVTSETVGPMLGDPVGVDRF
jgi:hypothetical protein